MFFHRRWILLVLTIAVPLQIALPSEAAQNDTQMFERLFGNWTRAFNNKDMTGATSLFSKECIATMPDAPHKDYQAICKGFKNIFASKTDGLQYKYKIHQIFRSGDLATVRITWYSSSYKQGKLISTTTEQGLDVFKKEKDGWKIVNFIAYTEK